MERNYMRPDDLVNLEFITETSIQTHWHENFELLVGISGKAEVIVEGEKSQLSSGDMILINANHKHSYQGTEGMVVGRFMISYSKARELLGMDHVLFWCNSTTDRNEAYDSLRRIIARILKQCLAKNKQSKLYLSSLYYQMLYILAENFTMSSRKDYYDGEKDNADDRIQEIFAYIRTNYRQNISLNDIAKYFYLSTTYVSKYIKQKCGVNFISLLNSVRLSHAIEDMMYSDESIMKVALDNGFASVAAFNKLFKDSYHQTPSEFRKQHKETVEKRKEKQQKNHEFVQAKVEQYLEQNPDQNAETTEETCLDVNFDINAEPIMEWDRYACKMINAGTAVDLLNTNIRQQILNHQERLGIRYVRFWDIYNPELYLDIHLEAGNQNFSRIDAVLDFLVENQLKPYVELGFKGRRIIRSMQSIVHAEERTDFFKDEEEMQKFYYGLFQHFIKRYGSWEVSQWYFEYWEKPISLENEDIALSYSGLGETGHLGYFRQFNVIAGALRELLPKAKIGGAGFPVRIYGEEYFSRLLRLWKKEEQQPDFLSLSCYPYMQEKKNGIYYEKRFSDLSFVRYNIEMAEAAMKKAGFSEVPIHVTEYSLSLSSRNVLNDSCLKAAYILNNTIDCMNKVAIMGHFFYTDVFAEERDTGTILFGGNGILTKDEIPKPSYYALEFLNQLYPAVQKMQDNYMITKNDRGSVRLICHNLKKPNYNYYLTEEDSFKIKDIPGLLNDREYLRLHICIQNARKGIYVIKKNVLNSHHGSIQNKWMDMNMEFDLTRKEMEYLRMSSICDISIQERECREDKLEFELEMEPNEICYIHIYRK